MLAVIAIALGLVALMQGVAWIGARSRAARWRGMALAPIGLGLLAFGVLLGLVPDFL